jgi:hypothetical protein
MYVIIIIYNMLFLIVIKTTGKIIKLRNVPPTQHIFLDVDRQLHKLDVRGSVYHSVIHKQNPTRCNSVSKFYFIFM